MASAIRHEGTFQLLTRVGFAARGLLYMVVAVLVLQTGRTEDLTGALEYVGQGAGKVLLVALICGLAVYGLWRLGDAAFGQESGHDGRRALGKRVVAGAIGCIYLYLSYKAVRVLLAGRADASDASDHAETALDLPGGEWVLGLAALVVMVAGANQLRKSWSCTFLRRLDEGAGQRAWVKWLGRLGYAARGVVFLVAGWLLGRAAITRQPSEAGSLEQALDFLSAPINRWVAAGLFLFGIFSLLEARFRRIHRPPIEQVEGKLKTLGEKARA